MKTKAITAVLLFMSLCLSAAAQVEKTPFLEGEKACWEYVQSIGYTENLKIWTDTIVTPAYPSPNIDITKHYFAKNPTDNSVVLLHSTVYDESYSELYTVVYVWPKKGYKKIMPKNLPKLKQTHYYSPQPFYLTEDRYKNTYAISLRGNPYRPIRGFSTIEPFTLNVNGQTHSGFIEK